MTTAATTYRSLPRSAASALGAPTEGWLTLGLVLVMALAVAWSLDDAAWVLGRDPLTDLLPWTAALGVGIAVVGVKVGWSRWVAHLIGAVFAALVIPVMVGYILDPDAASIGAAFHAAAESARLAWLDLAVFGRAATSQHGHFLIVLAGFTWGTGMYAASAVFRDHRPLDAAIALGLVLVVNMSLTLHEQLPYLLAFTLAALFLLIRSHAFDEQLLWVRNQIGDPSQLTGFYLRGGTLFVVAAVGGALLLTNAASSNPLAGIWGGVSQAAIDVGKTLERYLPLGGETRGIGVAFGQSTTISGRWITDGSLALTVELDPGELEDFYWRAVTYDAFDLRGWQRSPAERIEVPPQEAILEGTLDDPGTAGRRPIDFTVRREAFAGSIVFSPQSPLYVDQPSTVDLVDGQFFGALETSSDVYSVTAWVPLRGDRDDAALTENRLRVAGTNYPPEIVERYTAVPEGTIGPEAAQLLFDIRSVSPSPAPYDIARTAVSILHSDRFSYDDDITDLETDGRSIVETFAEYRIGYCQYYASTMAMLLRSEGIPTRVVEGFLPGDRELGTGIEKIYNNNAHMWVEVYFPGYGWVSFDPTGGGRAQLTPLPSGRPEATPPPGANPTPRRPSPTIQDQGLLDPDFDAPTGPGGTIDVPTNPAPFIATTLFLLLAVGALALAIWVRGPRGELQPDAIWGSIGRFAGRLGLGPRPTETVYEYAGALGELMPDARPALQTVADAKVEVAYGRGSIDGDRLHAMRDANRTLRLALLRLGFRPRRRRRR